MPEHQENEIQAGFEPARLLEIISSENDADRNEFITALRSNPDILTYKDQDGHTFLYHAIKSKNIFCTEELIKMGASPSDMGEINPADINDYRSDRKGEKRFEKLNGESRPIADGELLLQVMTPTAYSIYQMQDVLPVLQELIDQGNLESFKAIIESRAFSGVSANGVYGVNSDNLLHIVCRSGKSEFIEAILEHQFPSKTMIPVAQVNREGQRCYELMTENESNKVLITRLKNDAYTSLLVDAAREGVEKFKSTLAELGLIDINNLKTLDGTPLLHKLCAELGLTKSGVLLEIFQHLKSEQYKTDFNILNSKKENILFVPNVLISDNNDLFKQLVEGFDCNLAHVTPERRTPLCASLNCGRKATQNTEYLIEKYKNREYFSDNIVNENGSLAREPVNLLYLPDIAGVMPAHRAITANEKEEIFRSLIEGSGLFPFSDHGAWINYHTQDKDRSFLSDLIHYACEKGTPEIVRIVLEQYENELRSSMQNKGMSEGEIDEYCKTKITEYINNFDRETGYSALHAAVLAGSTRKNDGIAIINLLLEKGADINGINMPKAQNGRGTTSFGRAVALKTDPEIIKLLINKDNYNYAGSPENQATSLQQTPLMIMLDRMNPKSEVEVKDKNSKTAVVEKRLKNLKKTVAPRRDDFGIESQILPHLMELIGNDAEPFRSKDAVSNTPLHYLMRVLNRDNMSEEVVGSLVDIFQKSRNAGISLTDPSLANADGKTPMDLLAESVTNHYYHDIVPRELFDEKGNDALFEEYHINSIFEPIYIVSEKRTTSVFEEIANKNKSPVYKCLGELIKNEDHSKIYEALLKNDAASLQLLKFLVTDDSRRAEFNDVIRNTLNNSNILANVLTSPDVSLYRLLDGHDLIDYESARFANAVLDQLPDNSPYLDPEREEGISKWVEKPGFQINRQGSVTGDTILHKIFRNGHAAWVFDYIAHGADPTIRNANGLTPRQGAIQAARESDQIEYKLGFLAGMRYALKYARNTISRAISRENRQQNTSSFNDDTFTKTLNNLALNFHKRIAALDDPRSRGDALDAAMILKNFIDKIPDDKRVQHSHFLSSLNEEIQNVFPMLNTETAKKNSEWMKAFTDQHAATVQSSPKAQSDERKSTSVRHSLTTQFNDTAKHSKNVTFDETKNDSTTFTKGDESGLSDSVVEREAKKLSDSVHPKPK